jgi:hypothetical protein
MDRTVNLCHENIYLPLAIFALSTKYETQLERLVHFSAVVHGRPDSCFSRRGSCIRALEIVNNLRTHHSIDPEISATPMKALENHLWFVSDELVGLALFPISFRQKRKVKLSKG